MVWNVEVGMKIGAIECETLDEVTVPSRQVFGSLAGVGTVQFLAVAAIEDVKK